MDLPPEEVKQGAPEWVVTFGDMMTLLLCFFVLLLSFSTMEEQRFKVLAGYLRDAFGVQSNKHYTGIPSGQTMVSTDFNPPNDNKEIIFESIVEMLKSLKLSGEGIEANLDGEGTRLRIDGEFLFSPGSADLTPQADKLLDSLSVVLQGYGSKVVVEGHTDDRPIRSTRFPSNWELSASRSGAVVRRLETFGMTSKDLSVAAYAHTVPLESNDTPQGRSKNRRVEILIKGSEG